MPNPKARGLGNSYHDAQSSGLSPRNTGNHLKLETNPAHKNDCQNRPNAFCLKFEQLSMLQLDKVFRNIIGIFSFGVN